MDGLYALLTSQNNPRGDLVKWTTLTGTFNNVTSGISSTANQIAFAPDDSYAYITTTAGTLLKETYNGNTATQAPLTDNRLRGIEFYAPDGMTKITEAVTLTANEAGTPTAAFTILGCGASPSTVAGDGSPHLITMTPSSAFTLAVSGSGGSRYGFIDPGTFSAASPEQDSCPSGTCAGVVLRYDLQERLVIYGGSGVTTSPPSETGDGWYRYGDTLTVSSNGLGTRAAGSGSRISSWQIDTGGVTAVAALGKVSTSAIEMTAAHTVTFASIFQFRLTFSTSGPGTASAATGPSIPGDAGWYDTGVKVEISASPGSGEHFASWSGSGSGSYTGASEPAAVVMSAPIVEGATFQATQHSLLSLDGSASTGTNLGTILSVWLTTSCFPDVVVVLIGENTARATATAAAPTASGLTFTQRTSLQSGAVHLWEFYAIAAGPLSSRAITEVMSQQTAYTITAFGVCGADTASPFDPNPSLPKTAAGSGVRPTQAP